MFAPSQSHTSRTGSRQRVVLRTVSLLSASGTAASAEALLSDLHSTAAAVLRAASGAAHVALAGGAVGPFRWLDPHQQRWSQKAIRTTGSSTVMTHMTLKIPTCNRVKLTKPPYSNRAPPKKEPLL